MHFLFFPVMGLFAFVSLLIPVAIVVAVIWAVTHRPAYPTLPPSPVRETPLEILARRFAAGEITADEYQKAKELLQDGKPNP